MATTPAKAAQDKGAGFINQIHTIDRPEQTSQAIYRLLRKPIALCLAGLPPPFPALAGGACWASTSGLQAAAAVLDACVCWEGVKWAAKALIALLAAGLAEGWGVDCVEVPLAMGFSFLALGGVPSTPPYPIPWPGGASACQLPLSLVRGPPVLAPHISFPNGPRETRLPGCYRPYPN